MREWTFKFPSRHAINMARSEDEVPKWTAYDHVVMYEGDGMVYPGVAFTSAKDQYDRKKGWRIARGRARMMLEQEGHPLVMGRRHLLAPRWVAGPLTVDTAAHVAGAILDVTRTQWGDGMVRHHGR